MKNLKKKFNSLNREIENALGEGLPILIVAACIILFYSII